MLPLITTTRLLQGDRLTGLVFSSVMNLMCAEFVVMGTIRPIHTADCTGYASTASALDIFGRFARSFPLPRPQGPSPLLI